MHIRSSDLGHYEFRQLLVVSSLTEHSETITFDNVFCEIQPFCLSPDVLWKVCMKMTS